MSEYHKILRGLVENSDTNSALRLMKSNEIRKNSLSPLQGYRTLGSPNSGGKEDSKSIYIFSSVAILGIIGYALYNMHNK